MLELKDQVSASRQPHAPFRGAPLCKSFAYTLTKESPMLVKEIMSQPVITCQVDDHANLAAQRMWENDFGVMPILDGDGRAIAMLTDRDICMAAYTQGKPLESDRRALRDVKSTAFMQPRGCSGAGRADHAELSGAAASGGRLYREAGRDSVAQ